MEFQKRGLPHAHILLITGEELLSAEDIDKYVCAEIPDEEDTLLFETVKKNMVHGPCDSRCLKDNICSKNYPKDFNNSTKVGNNSYPVYKRSNNGKFINVRGTYINYY